jgi:hypothetical protein
MPDQPFGPIHERAIAAKRQAISQSPLTRPQRLSRFREIRRLNDALQELVTPQREELLDERARLLAGLHRNALAHNREYALVLHSEAHLRAAFTRAVPIPPAG